ncbi:MAG TPA: ABC transporter substrate-binding protein, partial [Nakamurella sp.]
MALAPVAAATLAVPFAQRGTGPELVGTGPFALDHYTKNTEVVQDRRADYAWGPDGAQNTGAAYLDQVVFKIVPESSVRTGSLESGQVQVIGGVAPQDIATLSDAGHPLVVRANPGLAFGLSPVLTRPIVAVDDVRRAIALAVDPTDVRDVALNDSFAVATSSLAHNTPGFADQSSSIAFDPDQAAALLDGAGWTVGADGIREKDGQQLH